MSRRLTLDGSLNSGLLTPSNSPVVTVTSIEMEVQAKHFSSSGAAFVQFFEQCLRHILVEKLICVKGCRPPNAVLTQPTVELLGAIHANTTVDYNPMFIEVVHNYLDHAFIIFLHCA